MQDPVWFVRMFKRFRQFHRLLGRSFRGTEFSRLKPVRVPAERPAGIARSGANALDTWNREPIIEKLREYVRILGARRGSQRDYRQYIEQNPDCGWPTASTITRHGLLFQEALTEARARAK
jgi:hypothetical protein